MRQITATVAGQECQGWFPERPEELDGFRRWVEERAHTRIAIDTETTGHDPFAADFRIRLMQFGDTHTGWVIPVEYGGEFSAAARWALTRLPLLAHNAPFDLLAAHRTWGLPLEPLFQRTWDTRILAHMVDSRPPEEGGMGLALKPLAAHYVDPDAEDARAGLMAEFRKLGGEVEGWKRIPLTHPGYLRYALLDVLYTSRLYPRLQDECRRLGLRADLAEFERDIAHIGAVVQANGMPLDAEYTQRLYRELLEEKAHYTQVAQRYGVTSVDAPRQVAEALLGMGETLTQRTESGQLSVAKEVLLPLADLDRRWERIGAREPNPLADAVLRAKRAGKWAKSYAESMLARVDANGRIHPSINTMGARTARWSVSNPPLQQLPSGDWRIRRCVVASPGNVIVASDFAQVEIRVLVALAGARRVIERINRGEDLHTLVTRLVFNIGPEVTDAELKEDPRRKLCKSISLGSAYAGGYRALAQQTGLSVERVKEALETYYRAIPEIPRYGKKLTREAQLNGMTVVTPSGRMLRLDRDKAYTAIAYMCQSSARDVLGEALLAAKRAGLLPHIIGVVHDEIIMDVPREHAQDAAHALEKAMTMEFHGVNIAAEAEIYGPSWGHGYGAPA